jgi:hypothetical protein
MKILQMANIQKFILGFGGIAFVIALVCTFYPGQNRAARLGFYLDQPETERFYGPSNAITNLASARKSEVAHFKIGSGGTNYTASASKLESKLTDAIDNRLGFYHELVGQLNRNLYLVAVVGGLSVLLVIKGKIKIPWVDADVPRVVALRVLPLVCLFLWVDFGHTLNTCIDARIVSMRLINANLELAGFSYDFRAYPDNAKNDLYRKAQYTLTRSSELEDHGLVDCWFWNFLHEPHIFPVAKKAWYNWVIPVVGIFWYAAIYGLLHAAAFYLPTLDLKNKTQRLTPYAWAILAFSAVVVSASHLGFYYAARHWNWFQVATLGFSFVICLLFCVRSSLSR